MYIIAAAILISIVLTARIANRWRLPLVVIALGAGILFGSDVANLVYFDDPIFAKKVGDLALIFVLFAGGFGTKRELLRPVLWPSLTMATLGVMITAAVTGILLWQVLGGSIVHALLIGCIISSTDAAAVFSILRSRSFDQKLSAMTEIESATNDPMAIVLTIAMVQLISAKLQHPLHIGAMISWQLAAGIGIGLLVGKLGCFFFEKIKMIDKGFFYILLVGLIFLSYGAADIVGASGMLSAFFTGYVTGNSAVPYKKTLSSFLEALSAIANVSIFVMLGLLVFPKELGAIWKEALILFIILTFIARPVSVFICTSFSRFKIRDKIFISWSGFRGAVPIVLATYPFAAGIESSHDIFNIIFLAVVLSMLVQGSTIGKLADWLKLTLKARPRPNQVMELVTLHESDLEICEIHIDEDDYEGRVPISSLSLPKGTTVTMINRNEEIIAPRGSTEILPGDVIYVLVKNTNIDAVTSEIIGKFRMIRGRLFQR